MEKAKSMVDTDQIRSNTVLSDIISQRVDIKKDGHEFKGCCPFHDEKTPSFTVSDAKDFYYCFGCGASGDAIQFIMDYHGVSFKDAAKIISGDMESTDENIKKAKSKKVDPYADFEPTVLPDGMSIKAGQPFKSWNPKRETTVEYIPSMVHPYRTVSGDLVGYVVRVELGNGKKMTPQIMWCRKKSTNEEGWCHYKMPEPRTAYRLDKLTIAKTIVIVEGEKCADALSKITDKLHVISWCGGSNAFGKTDWMFAVDRSVVLFPDADESGLKCAESIANNLYDVAKKVQLIDVSDKPKGWDIADGIEEGMTEKDVIDFLKSRARPHVKVATPLDPVEIVNGAKDEPFKLLGYSQKKYYFLRHKTGIIKEFSGAQLCQLGNLLEIAPYSYWNEKYFMDKDTKNSKEVMFNLTSGLIDLSERAGLFNKERIRGRGAWRDNGRYVYHLGSHLIVDGVETEISDFESEYIYQRKVKLEVGKEPLNLDQASKVIDGFNMLRFKSKADAMIVAGWALIAPVSGMLDWRTHLYMTAPKGSGKSNILNIVKQFMNGISIEPQGTSTEAGVRQALNSDTMPVLFDESENENQSRAMAIQSILNLTRSSAGGGNISKGGADGTSTNYLVKSPFLMASIALNLKSDADISRFIHVELVVKSKNGEEYDKKRWKEFSNMSRDFFTPEFCKALVRRSINMMPVIDHNHKVFREAGRTIFGEARKADTYAMIFAGYRALCSDDKISEDEAVEWIRSLDWLDRKKAYSEDSEESEASMIFRHITQSTVRVGNAEVSVGNILFASLSDNTNIEDEKALMNNCQMKIEKIDGKGKYLMIAKGSSFMSKVLSETKYSVGWWDAMKSMDCVEYDGKKVRITGQPNRVLKIKLTNIVGDLNE